MLMLLCVHVKFYPDYGFLLELHALTLVARSYALLEYHIWKSASNRMEDLKYLDAEPK